MGAGSTSETSVNIPEELFIMGDTFANIYNNKLNFNNKHLRSGVVIFTQLWRCVLIFHCFNNSLFFRVNHKKLWPSIYKLRSTRDYKFSAGTFYWDNYCLTCVRLSWLKKPRKLSSQVRSSPNYEPRTSRILLTTGIHGFPHSLHQNAGTVT